MCIRDSLGAAVVVGCNIAGCSSSPSLGCEVECRDGAMAAVDYWGIEDSVGGTESIDRGTAPAVDEKKLLLPCKLAGQSGSH